jgi:transposase-like protein
MVIFKCPYCRAEYEMTTARLSFRQRSYAKCHVCLRTMYSWTARNVSLLTLVNAFDGRTSDNRNLPLG